MRNARNMVGPQVRRIRHARGLSQPALAILLQRRGWDISRDVIAKIEDQRRWVADFEAAFLAEVLQVALVDLYRSAGRNPTPQSFIARLEHSAG